MAELRWHPLTQDWVMIASHRQARPQMPKDWCPFCPGSGKVPEQFEVYKYDNDFPALSLTPPVPDDVATDFYHTAPAYGKCEVILYASGHTTTVPELPDAHVEKLVDLWCERFAAITADDKIKYCYIFENRGDVVGVTMPHPHGQIYGFPFIPKKIALESQSAEQHFANTGRCLFCDMHSQELEVKKRIIFENEHFTVFLPFFTEYPYGVYIISKEHRQVITELTGGEKRALARTFKQTIGMLDCLFGYPFPYMMCMHNAPVNGRDYRKDYHFHIEFFPPMRSADKQKFNAASETGVWAHCNPTCPEETAQELRDAYAKYQKQEQTR